MNSLKRLALSLSASVAVACSCHAPAASAGPSQICALGNPTGPGLPRLYRSVSKPPPAAAYAVAPICTKQAPGSPNEPEVVDDLQAILGTGYTCADDADSALGACEGWARGSILVSAPGPAPCGPSACPNVRLNVQDPSGVAKLITFYDDIASHQVPIKPNCQKTGRACYYRVLRVEPALFAPRQSG